jgi:hypothetical protein
MLLLLAKLMSNAKAGGSSKDPQSMAVVGETSAACRTEQNRREQTRTGQNEN